MTCEKHLYYFNKIEQIRRNMNAYSKEHQMLVEYNDYLLNNAPYSHLITLTYPPVLPYDECKKMLTFFMTRLERKLFRKHQKHGFLEGFIIEERQDKSTNQVHHHLIIKPHANFSMTDKPSIESHFASLIRDFKHKSPNRAAVKFSPEKCDIRPVDDTKHLIPYLLKSYNYNSNFDFVTPIQKRNHQADSTR